MNSLSLQAPSQERESSLRRLLMAVWDIVKVIVVSAAIILPIRAYVMQPFFVRGASMSPTFADGEYLIIEEISYVLGLRSPRRGDVVVFRYPLKPSEHYIKRIVGLPNERVIIGNATVTVMNKEFPRGLRLDEGQYLAESTETIGPQDVTLRQDEYFVLGDNRSHSSDSRNWGPLPRELITGRAWLRVFPIARAGAIEDPQYGGLAVPAETIAPSPV